MDQKDFPLALCCAIGQKQLCMKNIKARLKAITVLTYTIPTQRTLCTQSSEISDFGDAPTFGIEYPYTAAVTCVCQLIAQ